MKNSILRQISVIIFGFLFIPVSTFAIDRLNVSLANMPVYAESEDKGVLVDFSKAIAEELGVPVNIVVEPFARSMKNVIEKKVDFHMPLIQSPGYYKKDLPYDHSTATIFHVNFVLYTSKTKPLTMEQLDSAKIETDRAHTEYFPFKTIPSSCIECSLKKISKGRIDGFIFADFATDGYLKSSDMSDIKRQLYRIFDVKIILPKGGQGGPIDKLLTKGINGLRAKGKYQEIMGAIDQPYKDWQP